MKTVKVTDTKEYQHILNKRNPFQLMKSEEIKARIEMTKKQDTNLKLNMELGCRPKPLSNLFDNITHGRCFN